jgi:lysozyme family protein
MSNKFNSFLNIQTKRVGKISDIEKLAPIVSKWEGAYVNDPIDKGGATNMGITLNTWKLVGYDKNNDNKIDKEDIKLLEKKDFTAVLKKYWNKWRADEILNQSISNILVDWYWISGKWGIVIPQRLLGLVDDGDVGIKTITKINEEINKNPEELFNKIFQARVNFYNGIVKTSIENYEKKLGRKATEKEIMKNTQKRFIKGWLNRLNDFKYY